MEQLTVKMRLPRSQHVAQRGIVLFIALIVLVALALAGISLIRSVDTSNVIAGNLAFKQGTLQAADVGVEAAVTALPAIIAANLNNNLTGSAQNYWYYATRRETDAKGVPTTKEFGAAGAATAIDWSAVPPNTTVAGNTVKIVIDRLCQGPAPVLNLEANCFADPSTGGSTKKVGGTVFSAANIVYYRVTVQVAGPRNTSSMVQAILSR